MSMNCVAVVEYTIIENDYKSKKYLQYVG